jgi:hypothetical protein
MNRKALDLSPETLGLIQSKQSYENQVVFGVLLVFFQQFGKFPMADENKHCTNLISEICVRLDLSGLDHVNILTIILNPLLRTVKRFKNDIRSFLQFTVFKKSSHLPDLINYCKTFIFPLAPKWDQAAEQAYAYLKDQKIEPYNDIQFDYFLTIAHCQFEAEFFTRIEQSLTPNVKKELDQLVKDEKKAVGNVELATKGEKTVSLILPMKQPLTLGQLKEEKAHLKI